MARLIDLIAKGFLILAFAVLGGVAALVHDPAPQMAHPQVEALSPADVAVSDDTKARPTAALTAETDKLERLEDLLQQERVQSARIGGKLDRLLSESKEGKDGKQRKPAQ